MKKYRVHYHFAGAESIVRIVEAEDQEDALGMATSSRSNDIVFTDSKGTLYCFFYRDVKYVSIVEDRS
ncbi:MULTISPECIES: hypothetical protein [unclassified Sporosarcina]|uniref:hypothetical protein n=1 Tax=unclassified Sporosarcina TaxID=2647733 RepID=UPI000C165049|nr:MULTISPECIES: hypothetical protein [unclassified Sporosarcina]PID00810.1 hypothetical protein CSV68_00890 [Sporosarcina sp. P29]PID07130.1 hypothetical protein CSV66_00680 [Sporosarcina sp. P30]PID10326.1 hypothetical protein CSV65_00685 [Sporosarcina sp. P31]PID12910.1 hypothetical protein CSV64_03265 [Sporosarcina sp. P32b]